MMYEYGRALVPKITLTLRKSYGGAHIAMCCKQLGGGVSLAWPDAVIAVMGNIGAGKVLHDIVNGKTQGSAAQALAHGYIDEIVPPEKTRRRIAEILSAYQTRESRI